jgi:hypothetical protein
MNDNNESQPRNINTEGGTFVGKGVNTGGGTFIGRDQIITITEETSYDVRGLPNPYLGLRAFDYKDRAAFGGRDGIIREALGRLTDPKSKQTLFFITGASGSGKSSFIKAGLVPALEAYYIEDRKRVFRAEFRPSSDPLDRLAIALGRLGLLELSADDLHRIQPDEFAYLLAEHTPKEQVNLLVIDQLEEIFSPSASTQRDILFDLLAALPPFNEIRTQVLITMRSDFLPQLFKHKPIYDISKQGLELRAMSLDELKIAIQQPLWAKCEKPDEHYCQKRFETALLDKLAEDTYLDAAFLPLLQVTLYELWKGGSLRLAHYESLTHAFRNWAETVYLYEDYDSSTPSKKRSEGDCEEIINLLLDFVPISRDTHPQNDVRRTWFKHELAAGRELRLNLINELVNARLLRTDRIMTERENLTKEDGGIETVDIIHEALLSNWDRIKSAIELSWQVFQRRARFEQALKDWQDAGKIDDLLLVKTRLEEARDMERQSDTALEKGEARVFLYLSNEHEENSIKDKLEQAQKMAIAERNRAEAEHSRAQTARNSSIVSIILLLFSSILLINVDLPYFLYFLIVGLAVTSILRGLAKVFLITSSIIFALFVIGVAERYLPVIITMVTPGGTVQLVFRILVILSFIIIGYITPYHPWLKDDTRFAQVKLPNATLGFLLGAINGYLLAGTIWYFYAQAGIANMSPSGTEKGQVEWRLLEMMPPRFLEPPIIYFAVLFVLLYLGLFIITRKNNKE